MRKKTLVCCIAVSASVLSWSAAPAQDADLSAHDTDGDGAISLEEFQGMLDEAEWYAELDADSSGGIDRKEAGDVDSHGGFSALDRNSDDELSIDEFAEGLFEHYDEDDDGVLDEDEFQTFHEGVAAGAWERGRA